MGSSPDKSKMHVVEGRPWKEAIITLLEPRSPYRPWRTDDFDPINEGDRVIAIIDTDPLSVLGAVGFVGPDGDAHSALAGIERIEFGMPPALFELDTLNTTASLQLPASPGLLNRDADAVTRRMNDYWSAGMDGCFGSSTLAQARTLLASGGRCTGCDKRIDLTGPNAADRVHFHTASRPRPDVRRHYSDWPAVLCDSCHTEMVDGGLGNFVDFRFSLAPICPKCSANRSMSTDFGEPWPGYILTPWTQHMGCCVVPVEWVCGTCGHEWASDEYLARWSMQSE